VLQLIAEGAKSKRAASILGVTKKTVDHHDRPSLLAGKLHAILQRPWTKGRDLLDLLWYLSDPEWPKPNLALLNAALLQTGWDREAITSDNWRLVVRERV
jgi:hypothetical protein